MTINPSDPAQDGIWSLSFDARNEVVKTGTGTAMLSGDNSYLGQTHILEGSLVAASDTALGDDADIRVDGGTLAFPADTNYDTPTFISASGTGATNQPGAVVSLGGTTIIGSSVALNATPTASVIGIGTDDGTFTIDTGAMDYTTLRR